MNALLSRKQWGSLWVPQKVGMKRTVAAIDEGVRSILVTAPTGAGKTRLLAMLSEWAVKKRNWRVAILLNRKQLTKQTFEEFVRQNIPHGVMAANHDDRENLNAPVQICSIQTLIARCYNRSTWSLPEANILLVDEAHLNGSGYAAKIIKRYRKRGVVVGFTATPIGLAHLYKRLIVAGSYSECIQRGYITNCRVYCPSEADMRGVRTKKDGEYAEDAAGRRIIECKIVGDAIEHWFTLNPDQRPTMLWAPSVESSITCRDQFLAAGVQAAHLDGTTPMAQRQAIFDGSRNGEIKVVCSCDVLREGVDLPWMVHGILLRPCRLLTTDLQIVGRLLRAFLGKRLAVLQDHVGAVYRHGIPTEDRAWGLEITEDEIRRRRSSVTIVVCPKCHEVRGVGKDCPGCGHACDRSIRLMRTVDGELVEYVDKPRLTIDQIVAWAKDYYATHDQWPAQTSGNIPDSGGETWGAVDKSLNDGLRGLPPGSSLSKLLYEIKAECSRLTEQKILDWVNRHYDRFGKLPTCDSGPIEGAEITWRGLNSALRYGRHGLPGGGSLASFLSSNFPNRPRLGRPHC